MTDLSHAAERMLLSDALEVSPCAITVHSREPLGAGSVTGMHVDGSETLLYYVDTSRVTVPAETGWVTDDARIWMHPSDPHLPALSPIAFDHAAETILARMGFTSSAPPQIIAYRPGRRAVLRVPAGQRDVWVKVTRPSRVDALVQAHAAFTEAGIRVPHLHGWSPDGLVVMSDADGTPAADFDWAPERLLDEVEALRERIARVRWDRPAPGAARRIRWYASRGEPRATALLERARTLLDEHSTGRDRAVVHGDLHYGQLFLDDQGGIRSVIDVDTLGVSDPAEDAAAFLAHAIASAGLTVEPNRPRVWALADAAAARWSDDPIVRALTTVHLVGHAISATDRADANAAERCLSAADAVMHGRAPSDGAD